ncbi:hypothetical protein DVDV_2756 [Desulfovibrio sp. DV]|uniref:DUF3987 domain-containing protein n=1 Tax=Desulfovibrio sp. DV TaxID=1844708 RepID=UPI00094BC289|nr:DUF3987 domain-containing protein [Desulfovibrio sp. DV]OLN26308.1 hypothetical protein DVDV_2756 [Desulfovibrio sp. DV]
MAKNKNAKKTADQEEDKDEVLKQKVATVEDQLDNTGVTIDTRGFPSLIKDYIECVQAQTGCDEISATVNVLSLISSVVQKSVCIPKNDLSTNKEGYFQKLYPNLWMIEVNKSGGFKTTAQRIAHAQAYVIQEIITSHNKSKTAADAVDNFEGTQRQKDGLYEKNIFLPTRTTFPALLDVLSKKKGGLILSSEFGTWLQQLTGGISSTSMRSTMADLYDAPRLFETATKTGGVITLEEPFISICGATTHSQIAKLLNEEDVLSGFLPRFLLFLPPVKDDIPNALPSVNVNSKYSRIESDMLKFLTSIHDRKEFLLSNDAKIAFNDVHKMMYDRVRGETKQIKDYIEPFLRRWSPYILKIAMLLHLAEDQKSTILDRKDIEGGGYVVECAYTSTKWLLTNFILESEVAKRSKVILRYIAKENGSCLRPKLLQGNKNFNADEIDKIIKYLEETGQIIIVADTLKTKTVYQIA